MKLPQNHSQRVELNDEAHARPPEALEAPQRVSYLALWSEVPRSEAQWRDVVDLATRFGVDPPPAGANHYSADLGPFRVKWERHTEFARYMFIVEGAAPTPFAEAAIAGVPADWLAGLSGLVIVASHAALLRAGAFDPADERVAAEVFDGNVLVGATVAGGAAQALTDFRIHADGFGRLLVQDDRMTPRQAGRIVQRLFEIDTYRIMALMALPVARALVPFLAACESELVEITAALVGAGEADEPVLLDRLARLEAEIESRQSQNLYRFSAASAYYELVQARVDELRETRIQGLQTFQEFTERRMAPAMNTCRSVAARQEALSQRIARATQMLATRVDISRERQNQAVLASMDRRAMMALRLQETVEGLSVAAVTYYIVGLIGYAAKGLKAAGVEFNTDLATGISIIAVAALTALGIRRIRKSVKH